MNGSEGGKRREGRNAWGAVLALLLLAGLAFRAFGAWCLQYAPNSDYGIVGLMAKHMAEGTDFPVFFYGQPYMGSLEPAISALLCKVLGISGFSVCLGTGALAFCMLPILYCWSRAACDRLAGIAAILFSLIGSFACFFYCAAPRGGYVSTLVLGCLTVWLAGRIAMHAWAGARVTWSQCALLGLGAGLAWWSNQLVVPFLAAGVLVVAIGFRGRIFRPALLLGGGIGFMAGSLPWWLWNATHEWESLEFGGTLGKTPFRVGLGIFGQMFLELMEACHKPTVVVFLMVLAYGLLLVGYGLELRRRWRERSVALIPLLSPMFVIVFMALVYATSSFARMAEVRYVLPAFPAAAILVGIGTGRWVRRTRLGWIPLFFLIAAQCHILPDMVRYRAKTKKQWNAAGQVADFLARRDITAAYGSYAVHWMNVATREALCVTGLDWERYAPYAKSAACADKVAYFSDHMGVGKFISRSGGTAQSASVGGYGLLYDAQPSSQAVTPLPTQAIQTVVANPNGLDVRVQVHDWDLDTSYNVLFATNDEACLEWTLTQAEPLCGVRVFNADGDYPAQMQIEGWRAGAAAWEELVPRTDMSLLFWSGTRIYYQGPCYFLEYRFRTNKYTALRMRVFSFRSRAQHTSLGEIDWLQPGYDDAPGDPPLGQIVDKLRSSHTERLYAPRWISEEVYRRTGASVETLVPALYTRRISEGPAKVTLATASVEILTRKTALLVGQRDADRTRSCLGLAGITAAETAIGTWVLFECPQGLTAKGHIFPPLRWTEKGCLMSSRREAKKNADYWYQEAQKKRRLCVDTNRIVEDLRRAVSFYPAYQPALDQLADMLSRAGQSNEAAVCRQEFLRQTRPTNRFDVSFANGVELLGVDAPRAGIRPGSSFTLTYCWRCPPDLKTAQWAAFVHFVRDSKQPFQDDHVLMTDVARESIEFQPFPEIFMVTRLVQVPAETPAGEYRMRLGIYDRITLKRSRPDTSLDVHHKAVWLPVTLRVEK